MTTADIVDAEVIPDNPQDVLRLTAIHEAGHVVARVDSDLPFEYVTIISDDPDTLGEVVVSDPGMVHPWDFALYMAAGPAAEAYALALADSDAEGEDEADLTLGAALCLASARHPEVEDAEAKSPGITGRIVDYVARRWDAVTAVADALVASPTGTLTYSECQRIVTFLDGAIFA